MNHLKSLTLTIAPIQTEKNSKLLRRQRLIDRLEEQRKLAADPAFTVLVRRWIKDAEGVKQPFDRQKRVKPWWRKDGKASESSEGSNQQTTSNQLVQVRSMLDSSLANE